MKIKENKNLLVVGAVLIVCLILIGFSSSIQGGDKSYKIRPEITLPEYRTDTGRAIDAYERIMDRFINLTERDLGSINTDVKSISKQLVLIDCKLTELSARMGRIEKSLGIKQAEACVEKTSEAKAPACPGKAK
jgi:hypothetical protein